MRIKQRIRSRLGRTSAFECVGCGLTVEDERVSCPACGWCLRKTR